MTRPDRSPSPVGMARRSVLVAIPAVAAALATPAMARPQTHTIVVDRMRFGPAPAGVRVGDTVIWDNREIFRHTATAADAPFDVDLPPRTAGSTVMRRAGTFPYLCRFHPGMTGQLTVGR